MSKFRLAVLFFFMLITTIMYWWASDPHSFWILWVTIPGFFIALGFKLHKQRKADGDAKPLDFR